MPTSAEIAEYLASEGLVDIQPWHDAEAISRREPACASRAVRPPPNLRRPIP